MDTYTQVWKALETVIDPELDEPITELGFVYTLTVTPSRDVTAVLRLPTSFCAPNFAYLMASDAKDVLTELSWTRKVVVELDGHHDSPIINAGLAADAGYRGTFGHEADSDLDELRTTFQRKAHTAAMERCLTAMLRRDPDLLGATLGEVTVADLPDGKDTISLLRHRATLGLPNDPSALVLVDHTGAPATRPKRCRWRCAGHVRRESASTATPTSAAACCAPATAPEVPSRRPLPPSSR
jgi:metal-sulfur cluster biosynthetic enzyme